MKEKTKMSAEELFDYHRFGEVFNDVLEYLDEFYISKSDAVRLMKEYASLKQSEWISVEDELQQIPKVTRVEVVDDTGRGYVNWNSKGVTFSIQDNGRTLKIFTTGSTTK